MKNNNRFGARLWLLLILMVTIPPIITSAEPKIFAWVSDGVEGLQLQELGKDVLFFQLATKSLDGQYARSNYVHPLYDLEGDIVTEDFPEDHPHQRGIFWAWHRVLLNGISVADPWSCRDIEWKEPEEIGEWVKTQADAKSANMQVVRDWVVPNPNNKDESLRVVRETVSLVVWQSEDNIRTIDFDLKFRALVEGVTIAGSDDVKGYGGFSPRIRLSEDVKFFGQTGEVTPQNTAVDGGNWMNVIRTLDSKKKGVAIMVHPSHPGSELKWILRSKRSMQNPQWPGQQPTSLSTKIDTQLRYRLVLNSGELNQQQLEQLWDQFTQTH
jgi:hypothetical protein